MFKEIAGLASMMKQAQKLSDRMQDISRQLKGKRVVGTSGGGMIEVEMNGLGECVAVKIDPLLVERGDLEMIEDLLPGALNQALGKAKKLHGEAMQSLTENIPVPGLNSAIAKLISGEQDATDHDPETDNDPNSDFDDDNDLAAENDDDQDGDQSGSNAGNRPGK